MIFVDSNVLIDLFENDPQWRAWSGSHLSLALEEDVLAVNVVVYAEIARSFPDTDAVDVFLAEFGIGLEPIPREAAFAASRAHQRYRRAGGARIATLPDFFIAAHAQAAGARLLTRDAMRVRTYFPDLTVIAPA
ncbi:type II toxin-antitoxin system VapC family toxin [Xylophilus sp.]|uniref:type II toxin-antitoxin system VapC family toxin n=1 Tax=Xylophilus sp. TaxID=2653893 RepID=UPI0013BB4F80|nr:type II toxin-antitoxin system VapC family toxin [Xylophilus sp.]KAF1045833.1 MAG: tRNA(fMet)-specific endonuclease VapC [Xylophilus sp.]